MAELFGRYRLDDRLGQGGMGVVYRAWDTVLERVVALKMVLSDVEGELEPEARERFLREARAAAHLTHRNIVTIYDLGQHEGRPYFAMEFLEGEDLQRRLSRPEKTSVWRKIDIAIEVCQGMEFAHAHGVIHRDLKPANIYITTTGGVKILDFGLARVLSSQMTRSNMLMGTLNYMAPEQVRGERADHQSDVFSVGVVLYELLGGRRAFQGDSAAATIYKILQEVPEPLWKLDPELPQELTPIVDRALAKPRDERYPDMASLRHDLESVRAVSYPSGPTSPWPSKTPPPAADITHPIRGTDNTPPIRGTTTPVPAPVATPAPATPIPVAGRGVAARGFWAGATVGALALGLVVIWMVAQRGRVTQPPVQPQATADPGPARPPAPSASSSASPPVAETPAGTTAGPPAPEKLAASDKPSDKASGRKREGPSTALGVKAQPSAPAPLQTAEARPVEPAPAASAPAAPAPVGSGAPPVTPTVPPPVSPSAPVTAATPNMPPAGVSQPAAPPGAPLSTSADLPALSAERANDLLARYKAALESKSLEQLKRIWPSMSGDEESAIRQEFQHAARIVVEISSPQVLASGSTGRISFVRNYSLVTVDGQRLQKTRQAVMDVRRTGDIWLIDAITFASR